MWNVELSGLAKKFWVLDGREGRDGQGSSEFWVLGSELEANWEERDKCDPKAEGLGSKVRTLQPSVCTPSALRLPHPLRDSGEALSCCLSWEWWRSPRVSRTITQISPTSPASNTNSIIPCIMAAAPFMRSGIG